MSAIQQKLEDIFDMAVANQLPVEEFNEFIKFETTLDEIEYYIIPFLKRLNGYKIENIDNDNFLVIAQTIDLFLNQYFNKIKENGYYKGEQLSILSDWLCLNCEEFFYLTDNSIQIEDIYCTNCGSKSYRHSNQIQKARIDGLNAKEIIAMLNLKKHKTSLIAKGINDINLN